MYNMCFVQFDTKYEIQFQFKTYAFFVQAETFIFIDWERMGPDVGMEHTLSVLAVCY